MRTAIFCTAVVTLIGLTGSISAQVNMPRHATSVTYGPSSSPTQIRAQDITYDDAKRTSYARGNVRIVSEVSTITADEADVHLLNFSPVSRMSIDLRGNVRVLIDPTTR